MDGIIKHAEPGRENAGLPMPPPGQAIQRMQDSHGFCTAMMVQQPRNLQDVERRVVEEATKLGDRAFYGWGGGKDRIEGPSVSLANALAREWGNSAVDAVPVQDAGDAWIFTAALIDLERGFTMTRQFRQSKTSIVHGRHDGERKDDIRFQIGQSKALRNAILNFMPAWLVDRAMEAAKSGVREKLELYIANHILSDAQEYATKQLERYGVTLEAVLAKHGRSAIGGLTKDDLITIQGSLAAIESGAERAETLFPPIGESKPASTPARKRKKRAGRPAAEAVTATEQESGTVTPPEAAEGDSEAPGPIAVYDDLSKMFNETMDSAERKQLLGLSARMREVYEGDIPIDVAMTPAEASGIIEVAERIIAKRKGAAE